jgi:hypothetical protein
VHASDSVCSAGDAAEVFRSCHTSRLTRLLLPLPSGMEMSCDPCGEDEWKGGGWGTSSTRLSEWGESNGTADFRQEVNKKREKKPS